MSIPFNPALESPIKKAANKIRPQLKKENMNRSCIAIWIFYIQRCERNFFKGTMFFKDKKPLVSDFLILFVTQPGFEPRQAESESAVLPLYYQAINWWQI